MSPFEQGRADAKRNLTACPFGDPYAARRWELGFEKERETTPGPPRFGARKGKPRRHGDLLL